MGRIFGTIQINGKRCRTLFDSGARNTYVSPAAAEGLPSKRLAVPRAAGLGGQVRHAAEICLLAMQKWGIRLIPEEQRLDLSHYPEEFTELAQA